MSTAVRQRVSAPAWQVTRPVRPSRVPGVVLAGLRDRGPAPVDHRLDPHPVLTLALPCGDAAPGIDESTGRQHRGSLVTGLGFGAGGAARVRAANVEWMQVRLSPAIAHAVLSVGPAELESSVVTLDDLWGERRAARLREQLAEAASWEERFALVEAILARLSSAGPAIEPELAWAWDRIIARQGQVRVEGLADELGWSRKRLWSRFHAQLGMPPKRAVKLVRFDRAATRLAGGQEVASVAADCGYADQSHLHRDVLAFTGVTPATVAGGSLVATADMAWMDHVPRLPARWGDAPASRMRCGA
ncbi:MULTISPECIES: helix-turn-helix domain-containing protein [Streptomyces]|uniref:Helix-turn-helix domain-containing protein n=1 Tax=Streptomyces solicathayae TaxID=3081768 RepID=A0ABZ0LKA0_9ACTN|nr:helix-turn-helix domain-containing protein [Streptomyces sp. HUAS YS2]WOX19939.1 helix-turn-helix domain-containing protein [Streptomyces sp. HUAS YS2]